MLLNSLFQFVFQSGEFLSDKSTLLGVSIDTVFTVTVTIAIFLFGYSMQKRVDERKEKKRLDEIEEYFKSLIRLVSSSAKQQSEALLAFSESVNERKEQHYRLTFVPAFSLEALAEIPNQDLFKIFISRLDGSMNEKVNRFRDVTYRIDYLYEVRGDMMPSFEKFIEQDRSYHREYAKHATALNQMVDDQLSKSLAASSKGKNDPLLTEIQIARINWMLYPRKNVEFQDMYVANDEYLAVIKKSVEKYFDDPRASALLYHIKGAQQAVADSTSIKKLYAKNFYKKGTDIKKAVEELDEHIKVLSDKSN